jgi:hypothetical protein
MKSTVQILGVGLPGKKMLLTSGPVDALDRVDMPNPIERHFGRRIGSSFDQPTHLK